jgi:DNA-binding SARP family transcriptional activator
MRAMLRTTPPEAQAEECEGGHVDLAVDEEEGADPDETPTLDEFDEEQQRGKAMSTPLPAAPLAALAANAETLAGSPTAAEEIDPERVACSAGFGPAVAIEDGAPDTEVPLVAPATHQTITGSGIAPPAAPSGDGIVAGAIAPQETAGSESVTPLEVFVFVRGEPRVRYRGRTVSLTTQGKNHLEFLAMLAAAPGGAVHRDVLEQALWPQLQESGDIYEGRKPNRASAICTRLREAVRRAAPAFPADAAARIVRIDRANHVRLNTDLVKTDAICFQRACERMRDKTDYAAALDAWREARELFREDLLINAGYLWVDDAERGFRVDLQEWYRALWADALIALAGRAERVEHDRPNAIALYEDAFAAECRRDGPVRENATRGLLRCHAAEQNFAAAERAYRALREEHRRKYGGKEAVESPLFDGDPETESLLTMIRKDASKLIAS